MRIKKRKVVEAAIKTDRKNRCLESGEERRFDDIALDFCRRIKK